VPPAESDFLQAFRAIFEEGNRAWNEGDFRRAYSALPEDFEHQLGPGWPEAGGLLRGPDEVVAFFEGLAETFPDIRTGPAEYIEADERTMVVGFPVFGTGRSSGVGTEMEIWQVWDVDEGLVPRRVIEYPDRGAALEAVGAIERPR
jgi:ketosteroid isomerase-like protein